jgi:SAM-dependent methyltransferase
MNSQYKEVVQANIELHSKLSGHYNTCEPHFRHENIVHVDEKLKRIFEQTSAKRLLDLGCGTGFIINIAKKYVNEIVGVDVTQAMLDKVDQTGPCKISLTNHDTGSYSPNGIFDVVTGYSFLHHLFEIKPTLKTAFKALKKGGVFYCDLDPNFYFWEAIHSLDRMKKYDPIVNREIEMVAFKDEDIEKAFGVEKDIFNKAEFGKNIAGGFKEEIIREALELTGFSKIEIFYHWFVGQGALINDATLTEAERFKIAGIIDMQLQKSLPLSRPMYKYLGFYATK